MLSGRKLSLFEAQSNSSVDEFVSYGDLCDALDALDLAALKITLQKRKLQLLDGRVAHCATTRAPIAAGSTQFLEADFHRAVLSTRRLDILDIATHDLARASLDQSASLRFSATQKYLVIPVCAMSIAILLSVPLHYVIAALSLCFSLFFFSLTLMRLVCLFQIPKVWQRTP